MLMLASAGVAAPATQPTDGSYSDGGKTFAVKGSEGWTEQPMPGNRPGLLLVGPSKQGQSPPAFRVQVGRRPKDAPEQSLDEHVRELIEQLTKKSADDMKIETTKLDGVEARKFTVTLQDAKGNKADLLHVVASRPPRMYIITYIDDPKTFDAAIAESVLNSFRWSNAKPNGVAELAVSLPARAAEPASAPATRGALKDRTFTNKKHKVRFKVPGTMEYLKADVPGAIALYRAKAAREGEEPTLELIQMLVIENSTSRAEVIVEEMQATIEKSGGKVVKSQPATLGGAAAHEITWAGQMNGVDAETKQVICVRDEKSYVLSFVAAPGNLDNFVKRARIALDSYEWLE
ncbi:MAG: hypothetical protein WBD40_19395 [Tepidisphaeraceae bacterium]